MTEFRPVCPEHAVPMTRRPVGALSALPAGLKLFRIDGHLIAAPTLWHAKRAVTIHHPRFRVNEHRRPETAKAAPGRTASAPTHPTQPERQDDGENRTRRGR